MKCPYCKKEIEKENSLDGWMRIFVINFMVGGLILGAIFTWLDNHTSIKMSVEDGLSLNWYLLPMLIWGIWIAIYSLLYQFKKVRGKWLIK